MEATRSVERVADEWSERCKFYSSWHQMERQPQHAELLAFGQDAVRHALERLRGGDHWIGWSVLLTELVGWSPYQPKVEGGFAKFDVHEQAEKWLEWGRENGHVQGPTLPAATP